MQSINENPDWNGASFSNASAVMDKCHSPDFAGVSDASSNASSAALFQVSDHLASERGCCGPRNGIRRNPV